MSVERVDAVVVGAGVVGLACARALALAGREVLVLEAAPAIGTGTSSRNSEVVHAGLYYPSGSLKARLCVQGRDRLYAYAASRGIGIRRCGKLVVATDEAQLPALQALRAQALANGVDDVACLAAAEAQALEPAVRCVAALSSPSTGIVDSHALMLALQADLEHAGGMVVFNTAVTGSRPLDGGHLVEVEGADPLHAALLVNSAGLDAPRLAAAFAGLAPQDLPQARYARGHYASLTGRPPFRRLVYPMPEPGGLGVHFTLDLAGQGKFGPDVEWVDAPDYRLDPARIERFYASVRNYLPSLADGALQPSYVGVRPKIHGPGERAADFRIDGPERHGLPGLVNLFGIESPGLTSSLAIADEVLARLGLPVHPTTPDGA